MLPLEPKKMSGGTVSNLLWHEAGAALEGHGAPIAAHLDASFTKRQSGPAKEPLLNQPGVVGQASGLSITTSGTVHAVKAASAHMNLHL